MSLRPAHQRALARAVAQIEDPRSVSFRQFIDPAAFGRRFGISRRGLAALEREIRARGLHIDAAYPQRTALRVSGSVATVERLLHVRLLRFGDARGRRYIAPAGAPSIPPALGGAVDGITGLDTRPRVQAHDVPRGGLTPQTVARAYDVSPLHHLGVLGQGRRIALISFATFDPGDVGAFAARYGIPGPAPRLIAVDGGTSDTADQAETELDIDVLRALAPQAQVLVYEAPASTSGYADAINRIVADRQTDVISSSWGQCEIGLDPAERLAEQRSLTAAVAAGVTTFVATGDAGAYDCQQADLTNHSLSVDWPASSADAVAVGGTRLYLRADGSYLREAAWEDQLSAQGGGGGSSILAARPAWQAGLGDLAAGSRQTPDVSAAADPGTPWSYVSYGAVAHVGGTSAATPFWAATALLVGQYAAGHGIARIGFLAPILYALASSRQPFAPLHDVVLGGNRYYQAGPGWDAATGLGSPEVYNLARDVVRYLRRGPSAHHRHT
jgi:kumamolisin